MKEAYKVNLDGYYVEPVLVPFSQTGMIEIRELLPAEDDEEPEEIVTGYIIAEKVPNGLFTPRWDFDLWDGYQITLAATRAAYDQALADWYALPEEERGERPVYTELYRPECWIEGMAQEEIDEIRNAPQPVTTEQRFAQLEDESAMLALELVDTQIQLDQSESESAMLALELIDTQIRLDQTESEQAALLLALVEAEVI